MHFKKLFQTVLIFTLALVSCYVNAADFLKVAVKLTKLEVVKSNERFGDKLYFSISAYPSKAEPKLTRVPMFPLHWLQKEISKISNVTIWEGTIEPNAPTLLIISLMEQDLPPWDSDDHLGSVQVKLVNKDGKISATWGQPHFIDQPKVEQPDVKIPRFVLNDSNSKYVTEFKVETLSK